MYSNKINELLCKMSLEEKSRQMLMIYSSNQFLEGEKFSKQKADEILKGHGIGCISISPCRNLSKRQLADFVYDFQKYLIENTEQGIPALIVSESLHGLQFPKMTVYPQIIGLSCAWDEQLVEDIAKNISEEAVSVGVNQVLAPDLDLAREPRWGRVEETYGEDPYLTAKLGASYTRGIRSRNVAATLKHYVAHGEPENGINLSPVNVGERKLRELYLPVFEASIKEDPLSVMPAYHEMDGIPCHTSKQLLTDILRDELGFEGYTISDFEAVNMLCGFQKTATDAEEAGAKSLIAGLDLEAPKEFGFGKKLLLALEAGKISLSDIDRAVKRILYVKAKVGLLDDNCLPTWFEPNRDEHRKLALKAAEESIVLLKNNGILPINDCGKKIAVIGPNAAVTRFGDYCSETEGVTLLEGLKNTYCGDIEYCKGSSIFREIPNGIEDAVEVAKESDVVILALGGSAVNSGGVGWGDDSYKEATCGEGYDNHDLRLPPAQMKLAESILDTGKPVVLLLQDGRPCAIPEIYDRCEAIIQAWYSGEEGGTAMAEILLGLVNPCGKLTVTIPKHVGQVPLFYNHKPSARGAFYKSFGSPENPGRSYTILDPKPYYEFGFGLSYTQFMYSNLNINIADNGEVTVTVDVKNVGARVGKEIVQLYINDMISSVTTPVKALKGFTKVSIEPNETKTVEFKLGFDELHLIDVNMNKTVEPGWFEVYISDLKGSFNLSKDMCKALNNK